MLTMKQIALREFQLHPTKYLKELPLTLMSRGRPVADVLSPNTTITIDDIKGAVSLRKLTDKQTRRMVLARDNYTCRDCGTKEDLSIDHVKPKVAGGKDHIDNYETVCRKCNVKRYQTLIRIALKHWYECPNGNGVN